MQSSADTMALAKVEAYLAETVKNEPTIRSAAVLTADGLPLVLLMGKNEVEKLELAAAIASLGSLSEQTANRLRIGKYMDLMLRCQRGHLLVRWIGATGVLAVIADHTAPLGATTLVIDSMAKRLQKLLK